MKKSLCIDARMLFSSGIGTYIRNLIPLIESNFTTTLLIKSPDMKKAQEKFSSKLLCIDAPIYSTKEQFLLPVTIPSCDIFWSPHYNIPLLPIRAKKRIVTIHDICHLALPQFFPKHKRILARFLLQKAMHKSNLVLTVSQFSKKEIEKAFPLGSNKIHVITNGIEEKTQKKDSLQIEKPYLLYVGNLKPHKNIDRLLTAFLRLPTCYNLILAGRISPPFDRYPSHPRIHFLGEVTEEKIAFLYQNAEALIQPSLYEGFGLTPLEAMRAGCPVLASSIEALEETCGPAALYIDSLSTDSLYLGMKEILGNQILRGRLISAGFQRLRCFSWERSANQLLNLLNLACTS